MLATQQLIAFLEQKYYGQAVPTEQVIQLATQSVEFAEAWAIHCIGSDVSANELSTVLTFVASHQPSVLQSIGEFLGLPKQLQNVQSLVEHLMLMQIRQLPSWFDQIQLRRRVVASDACEQLIAQRRQLLEPASVYADDVVDSMKQHVRDCSQSIAHIYQRSLVTALLERQMAYQANMPLGLAEPLVILSYQQGQKFDWHYDYIDPNNQAALQELEFFGQRIFTSILYLNDQFEGGQTLFRRWHLECKPETGAMVSFFNVDPTFGPAVSAEHKGAPPNTGEKWVATQWFRQKPLWTRQGLFHERW